MQIISPEYTTANASKPKRSMATLLLVLACIAFYPIGRASDYFACSSYSVFMQHRWWTLFTALFVHGSLSHLLGNMLFLFLFGRGLEREIGSGGLLIVFLIGGAASMLCSIFFYQGVVGASGAISAILATLMLFNPWKLSLLLNLFPMPIGVAGFTYMLLNLWNAFAATGHPSAQGMNVAYIGHISGFVAGIFFGMALCPDWKKNLLISILQFVGFYALLFIIMHFFGLHFVS